MTKDREKHQKELDGLVSDIGNHVPPSGIREFFDIVYSTPDCISLGVGEPDFITPWRISENGIFAIKDGHTHYTPNRGIPDLLELTSNYLSNRYKLNYDPEKEMIITMGVSQGLDLALRSIINPGDEVIIFEPCYVSYGANISMLHGKPVPVATHFDEDFTVNIENLKNAITDKTKAILLNYPSNPTGATINKKIIHEIADIAISKNLIIIADEIYSALTYDKEHFSISRIPEMKDRTIYLNGFSKSHAMTGWRLGYIAGPEYLISIMLKIHQYIALCASSISQYAAIEAISHSEKDVERMKQEYKKRKNYITNRFNDIGLKTINPDGAFYVFPNISSTGLNCKDFALKLLDSKKVAVVPGKAFGKAGEDHIRCSFATSMENIRTSMNRIEEFISEL